MDRCGLHHPPGARSPTSSSRSYVDSRRRKDFAHDVTDLPTRPQSGPLNGAHQPSAMIRAPGCRQDLPRLGRSGGRRPRPAHPGGRDPRPGRPVRLRQEHHAAPDQPDDRAHIGPHHLRRRGRHDGQPDQLRRQIGYVIQQIGLFPHQTIAQNIATVPKLLGWDKKRKIAARVDELLRSPAWTRTSIRSLPEGAVRRPGPARRRGPSARRRPRCALDGRAVRCHRPHHPRSAAERVPAAPGRTAEDHRLRHPRHRRGRQDGRPIAILGEQSVIRQFDTPERILAYPVDDFVSDFIGAGSTLKGLNFERVRDLQLAEDWPIISVDTDRSDAQRLYDASPEKWMLVLDGEQRPIRWVNTDHLADTARRLSGRPVRLCDRRAQCHAARRPRRDAPVERRPGSRHRREGTVPGNPRHRTSRRRAQAAAQPGQEAL